MRDRSWMIPLTAIATIAFATQASAEAMVREQKIISSAGARAMVDACAARAEHNHVTVAMSVLDWGGNLIESHAMEGAAANAIDTALLKAKSALRWRRPTSEMNRIVRSGQNLAPTFMHDFPQPGALPIVVDGEVIGSMGVPSDLPVGISFLGPAFGGQRLLSLGYSFEHATRARRRPVHRPALEGASISVPQ